MVVAAVAGVGLIALLIFLFRDQLGEAFGSNEAEKVKEAEAAARRDEKGAIGNTIDWLFGEGTHSRNEADKLEKEGAQREVERPNNVAPSNPAEPTPWESITTWWTDNVAVHFEQDNALNPPAVPEATQGPPSESVEQVVHTNPPTEAAPQGMATRGGAGSGRAGRGR